MDWNSIVLFILVILVQTDAVRLHTIFQYLEGYKSNYKLRGFLHLGNDYAVFVRLPKAHDKYLVYELYESKKSNHHTSPRDRSTPRIVAISKVPVEYLKEQLKIYREELYKAKYVDANSVPGTQVKSLREWQIHQALKSPNGTKLSDKPILRSLVL
ncbi:uncharacterized protein LOC113228590 [Hyposmocoma kahamanoa]|uniref:uncharacterized protein LOC113228590 n=1 Tax=Hyposmocoma kahamanoa TaxID=1477025 RepID=UPI000E6D80DE|nr:uncharacterized protein LOC113228590 [Hyposmocoma kahamanoa]